MSILCPFYEFYRNSLNSIDTHRRTFRRESPHFGGSGGRSRDPGKAWKPFSGQLFQNPGRTATYRWENEKVGEGNPMPFVENKIAHSSRNIHLLKGADHRVHPNSRGAENAFSPNSRIVHSSRFGHSSRFRFRIHNSFKIQYFTKIPVFF